MTSITHSIAIQTTKSGNKGMIKVQKMLSVCLSATLVIGMSSVAFAQTVGSSPVTPTSTQYSALIGKWAGHWNGTMESSLVIDQVDSDGRARGSYIFRQNAPVSFTSVSDKGVIQFGEPPRPTLTFKLNSDGKIEGVFNDHNSSHVPAKILMTKARN